MTVLIRFATAAMTLAVVMACGAQPPSPEPSAWIPLAVLDSNQPGGIPMMDGLEQGRLVLTEECAFIDSVSGERHLVVWPLLPERWTWDQDRREIVVTSLDRYGSGDLVRLGGGGRVGDQTGTIEEILARMVWVAPPARECITPRVFFSNGEISAATR